MNLEYPKQNFVSKTKGGQDTRLWSVSSLTSASSSLLSPRAGERHIEAAQGSSGKTQLKCGRHESYVRHMCYIILILSFIYFLQGKVGLLLKLVVLMYQMWQVFLYSLSLMLKCK